MSCKSIRLQLCAYLDGELSGVEMIAIRNHLNACKGCQLEAEELRSVKSLLGNMQEVDPGEEFRLRLQRTSMAPPKPSVRPMSVAFVFCTAFATALILSLAGLQTQTAHSVARPFAARPDQTAFDVSRDQAYQAGGDVFNDGSFIITASAPTNGSR